MPDFRYTAVNTKGESVSGSIRAAHTDEAKRQLELQGLRIQAIVEEAAQKLSAKDAQELGHHIADLTSAGLPVGEGLRALADELAFDSDSQSRMVSTLRRVAKRLEAGDSLTDVMAGYRIPNDLRAIITAGMQTGRAPEAVGEYTAHVRSVNSTLRLATFTLAYPLMVVIAVGGIAFFIFGVVVPQFKKIFEDFGIELPRITQIAIAISDVFQMFIPDSAGLKALLGILALCIFLMVIIPWLLLRVSSANAGFKRIRNRIPILGRIFQWAAMAKFSHLIAVLINHNVPLPDALRFAGRGTEDPDVNDTCIDLANQVDAGQRPSVSTNIDGFPAGFIQLLAAESDREGIPEAMHSIANMYESRIRMQSLKIAGFFEPLIIIFLIGLPVGFLVLALFTPLIKLLNDLS